MVITPLSKFVLILSIFSTLTFVNSSSPCIKRDFGHSSFVCVCNSTYCDTHDKIEGNFRVKSKHILSYLYSQLGSFYGKTLGLLVVHNNLTHTLK